MVTNFAHMENQKDIYDKLLFVEDMLVDGDSREEYVQAMAAMRGALDVLMEKWVRKVNLPDSTILRYMSDKFGSEQNRVNLYGRIYALEKSGKIDADTAKKLHNIRSLGNDAVHNGDDIRRMSKQEVYKKAEDMYEQIYYGTYCYVNAASVGKTAPAKATGKAGSSKESNRAEVKKPKFLGWWLFCCLILLVFPSILTGVQGYMDESLLILWIICVILILILSVASWSYAKKEEKYISNAEHKVRQLSDEQIAIFNKWPAVRQRAFIEQMDNFTMQSGLFQNNQQFMDQMNREQQQQFMDQQQRFMDQMNMDQQQQFLDQQQQFAHESMAFVDPLDSSYGLSFDNGLDFGGGMDFGSGLDFGGGFGGGFGGMGF